MLSTKYVMVHATASELQLKFGTRLKGIDQLYVDLVNSVGIPASRLWNDLAMTADPMVPAID